MKDYYKILGIHSASSNAEIKKAFRKNALILHPDKSKSDTKVEFIELFEAYSVLVDDVKRKKYDKIQGVSSAKTTQKDEEALNVDLQMIGQQGEVYAGNFKKFNDDILMPLLFVTAFLLDKLLVGCAAAVVVGLCTIIKGLVHLQWDYTLIGVAVTSVGMIFAKLRLNSRYQDF